MDLESFSCYSGLSTEINELLIKYKNFLFKKSDVFNETMISLYKILFKYPQYDYLLINHCIEIYDNDNNIITEVFDVENFDGDLQRLNESLNNVNIR